MAKKPILVVMAAGMGSRYGGLKQIDPVGSHGEAILDYSLFDAKEAGFETAVIIIKEAIREDFMATVGKRLEKCPLEIRYAYQELHKLPEGFSVPEGRVKPFGTGHAILCAKDVIGDAPFAVINADDYYGKSAFKTIFDYLSATEGKEDCHQYCMVGYYLKNTVSDHGSVARGVCQVDSGYLSAIVERTTIEKYEGGIHFSVDGQWTDLSPETLVSMNMFGLPASFLEELALRFPKFLSAELPANPMKQEFLLPAIVGQLLAEGKAQVRVLSSADKWYGVTYAADKPLVMAAISRMTQEGLYPDGLWK